MFRSPIILTFFLGPFSLFAASESELEDGICMEWYEQAKLSIAYEGAGGGYLAVNTQQDLITRIVPEGLVISGPARSPFWETSLQLSGFRRGCSELIRWRPEEVCPDGSELRWQGNGLTMHYEHSNAGMRQNFILDRAPVGVGDLQVVLHSSGDLQVENLNELAIRFVDEFGTERFRYEDLKVWDACGTILHAHMQADPNTGEVVLHIDDHGASYPITVDPITTVVADLSVALSNVNFGWVVRSAGDVNGDGYSDVIVAAPYYTSGQLNEGGAFVYYGGPNGLSAAPDVILQSNQIGANFGWSVAHAGDLNGDGFSDIIVGAIYWESDIALVDEGAVFVYYGSATGVSSTEDVILRSNLQNGYMGWSVSGAGDLNSDGFSDIIVGSNLGPNGQFNEGLVWVFLGSTLGVQSTFCHFLERNQTGAQFGNSVAGAGDINGDGFDDVIIGAPRMDVNVADDGAVFIYYGGGNVNRPLWHGSGTLNNPAPGLTFNSAGTSFRVGWAVAGAGDVNGDGYSDVIIGDWRDNIGNQSNEGTALVYHGSATGLNSTPATVIQNDQSNSWLGRSVSSAGDINGDGYSDVAIGASQFQLSPRTNEGAVYIHLGGPSGISPNYFILATGGISGMLLGESVAVAGDINGDGYSDLIAGAYKMAPGGAVRIWMGGAFPIAPSTPAAGALNPPTTVSAYAGSRTGTSVANAGDVNGDGFSDVIIGAPDASNGQANEGLAFVYYGSSNGLSATPDLTLEVNVANARFGYCVATAGDVDGDGYADVVVGAPEEGGNGRIYIFKGGPGGLSATPFLTLNGTAGSRYGHAVSTAGDVNGDGYSDVIIGAPNAGTASVHLGSASGTEALPHLVITGPQPGSSFGYAVSTAGDVNGTGFSSIIVGAPDFTNGQVGEGAAYAYYGSDSGLVAAHAWMKESNGTNARFGASVAGVGDVNGDGYFDVAVGAPTWSNSQPDQGAVFYYTGTPTGVINTGGSRLQGTQINQQLGFSVAEGGDINGDGYADFVAGGPYWSNPQASEGRVVIYTGVPVSNPPAAGLWESNVAGQLAGWSVAGGGDVDGDGFSDVIVGSPGVNSGEGAHTVLKGNWSESVSRPTRLYRADLVSPLATNALDPADGLYFGIGHLARSHMQRKPGKLIWEVVHEGQPFSTSPIANSITNSLGFTDQSAGFTDLGVNGVEIKQLIYKEPHYRRYKWRVRVEWPINRSIDGQRYSRWFYGYASAHGDIGVLPLELLDFYGEAEATSNLLHWTTATETGTSYFGVERSSDSQNFLSLGRVAAAENSFVATNYHFADNAPLPGLSYYRLRMQDLDGSFTHSPVIALHREGAFRIHPNPVEDLLMWDLQKGVAQRARIYDALGRMISDVSVSTRSIEGGPLRGLPSGYYALVLLDDAGNVLARSRFLKS